MLNDIDRDEATRINVNRTAVKMSVQENSDILRKNFDRLTKNEKLENRVLFSVLQDAADQLKILNSVACNQRLILLLVFDGHN